LQDALGRDWGCGGNGHCRLAKLNSQDRRIVYRQAPLEHNVRHKDSSGIEAMAGRESMRFARMDSPRSSNSEVVTSESTTAQFYELVRTTLSALSRAAFPKVS